MIKVMNLIALIMAPIVVQYTGLSLPILLIIVVCVVLIIWAVKRSDREEGSLEDLVTEAAAEIGMGD
jgi:hypothetical protein